MGFSPLGLIVAVVVLAPNLVMVVARPRDSFAPHRVPGVLTWLERAGQALCIVVPIVVVPRTLSWWWVLPGAIALGIYYALWARYLARGRRTAELYLPLWGIPVPMAILPVLVFLASSAWMGNIWLTLAAAVLAAGHIPASAIIASAVRRAAPTSH